jgi:hypothetical protein
MPNDLLHGAEVKQGYVVSGDHTVMAFCRFENTKSRTNFIQLDVDEKKVFCEPSVASWLPGATATHLTNLSRTIAEKKPTPVTSDRTPAASPGSSTKKSRYAQFKKR